MYGSGFIQFGLGDSTSTCATEYAADSSFCLMSMYDWLADNGKSEEEIDDIQDDEYSGVHLDMVTMGDICCTSCSANGNILVKIIICFKCYKFINAKIIPTL